MLFRFRRDPQPVRVPRSPSTRSGGLQPVRLGMFALVLAVMIAGCASPRSATGAQVGRTREVPAAASGVTDGAADPLAPTVYQPVIRDEVPVAPTVVAADGGFAPSRAVTYADGISVRVDRVDSAVERANGPGQFPGRPNSALHLTIRNDSDQPVALDAVVVTVTYGEPARLAAAVYEDSVAQDFNGSAAPGASMSATYVFAVPPEQRRSMAAFVDFDGVHAAATFRGGVR